MKLLNELLVGLPGLWRLLGGSGAAGLRPRPGLAHLRQELAVLVVCFSAGGRAGRAGLPDEENGYDGDCGDNDPAHDGRYLACPHPSHLLPLALSHIFRSRLQNPSLVSTIAT